MVPAHSILRPVWRHRLEAVLAMLQGEPVTQVLARFSLSRSDLYKFRRRALDALQQALADHPRGPKRPHNRLATEREQHITSLCQRHPTWSSYQMHAHLGDDAPPPRTIQRVRQRRQLPRLSKRPAPRAQARRLSDEVKQHAQQAIEAKPSLGPKRLTWEIYNSERLQISPSTIKRLKRARYDTLHPPAPPAFWQRYERHHPHSLWHGDCLEKITLTDVQETAYQLTLLDDHSRGYVFCDLVLEPDQCTTIHALIAAMRQWQVIPKVVIFDNGSIFKGKLLSAFCTNVGVRLTPTAIRHPQTNGKLERAFRDDMQEFYRRYAAWFLEPLRRDLPAYVHYRNHVRGHSALGGRPSITRLQATHDCSAPCEVLEQLESYAGYIVGRQIVRDNGCIRVLGRNGYLDRTLGGEEVVLYETLQGLEVHIKGESRYCLREYRAYHKRDFRYGGKPVCFDFEPYDGGTCPRIAVAQ